MNFFKFKSIPLDGKIKCGALSDIRDVVWQHRCHPGGLTGGDPVWCCAMDHLPFPIDHQDDLLVLMRMGSMAAQAWIQLCDMDIEALHGHGLSVE